MAMNTHVPTGEVEGKYREHGIVCRLKDTNGFIRFRCCLLYWTRRLLITLPVHCSRPRPHLGRLFFHFKYVRCESGWKPSMLEIGSEVSYIVCQEGSRMFAADVVLLPKGTIVQESEVEGHFKGHIIKPATAPTPDDHREDGLIGYTDDDGIEQKAFYGHHHVTRVISSDKETIVLVDRWRIKTSLWMKGMKCSFVSIVRSIDRKVEPWI